MNPVAFSKLSKEERTRLLEKWRRIDEQHNQSRNIQSFQATNSTGIWRLDATGRVSVILHEGNFRYPLQLTEKELTELCNSRVKNKDYCSKYKCLDTSKPENWVAFHPQHVKKALRVEARCGGGSFFQAVPAKILAARLKIVSGIKTQTSWWSVPRRSTSIKA